jgi:hypothetical protein
MKRIPIALSGFKRFSDEHFSTLASTIYNAMESNPHFDTPAPELADVKTVIDAYDEKLAMARRKGSPYDTAVKNEVRLELEKILAELAFYVNKEAEGNLPILLSSGFQISGDPRTQHIPIRVEGVKLSDGRQSGQLVLRFEIQENIRLYEYCYAFERDEEREHIWSEIFKTSSSNGNLIATAIPGMYYYVRVRAINTQGVGEWSEPVSMMAR